MVTQINFGNLFTAGNKQLVSGISSGLDTKTIVEELSNLKRLPAVQLEEKIEDITAQNDAYAELKKLVEAFKDSADLVRNPPGISNSDKNIFTYRLPEVSSNTAIAGSSYVSVTAEPGADINSYTITEITSLAKAKKQQSDLFTVASLDDDFVLATAAAPGEFGAGTVTINGADITFEEGDSLREVVQKFNSVKETTGIAASVVQVSDGNYRVLFTATETGEDADFDLGDPGTVTADPSGAFSQLSFSLVQSATNAEFKIDGIAIERQTNQIDDVIDGVTFSLLQQTPDALTEVTVAVEPDREVANAAITRFVDDYNNLRLFIAKQTELDESGKPKDSAILASSQTLRSLLSNLTSELANSVAGLTGGDPNKLSDLGIKFSDYAGDTENPFTRNILTIDSDVLDGALTADFDAVAAVFGFNSTTPSSDLQIFGRTNGLTVSSFDVALDPNSENYFFYVDSVQYTFDATEITGGGVSLVGPSDSPIAGLQLIFTGTDIVTGTVNVSQGLGDRIFNSLDNLLDEDVGALSVELDTLTERTDRYQEEITRIDEQVEAYRDTLVQRFSALEAAIARVNTILQSLDAQSQARNSSN